MDFTFSLLEMFDLIIPQNNEPRCAPGFIMGCKPRNLIRGWIPAWKHHFQRVFTTGYETKNKLTSMD
jgi:hypothetical protein